MSPRPCAATCATSTAATPTTSTTSPCELEIPLFAEVLRHCDGNQSRAASMLGIHRATLRKKLKDYGLSS